MRNAYLFDAIRTPRGIGKSSGALYEVKPIDLLTTTLRALKQRNALPTQEVSDAIIGCVTPVAGQGSNIAKAALLHAGWSNQAAGMQINRFCTSGLEAINLAMLKIRAGFEDLVVAGGVESMSQIPMGSDGGALIDDPEVIDRVNYLPQGVAADLIATMGGFSRMQVDEYALLSQERAITAMQKGYFKNSIIPVKDQNGLIILAEDEYIRPDSTIEGLTALPTSFNALGELGYDALAMQKYPEIARINHVHTAGNSSGIVDGSALVLVGSDKKGKEIGLQPRAKIVSVGLACVEPTLMLTGTIPAAQRALANAGMQAKDIDLWECNEAFASVVLKFQQAMDINLDQLNVNGGAIALGHPLGATGAMLVGTILDELERRNLSTGLITIGAVGGMGVATIIERV